MIVIGNLNIEYKYLDGYAKPYKSFILINCKIAKQLEIGFISTLILKDCEIDRVDMHHHVYRIILINSKIDEIIPAYANTFIYCLCLYNSTLNLFSTVITDDEDGPSVRKILKIKLKNSKIKNIELRSKKQYNKEGFYFNYY